MAQGNPDFSNQVGSGQKSGDLASRVGGIAGLGGLHSGGTWIWYEGFEGTTPLLAWQSFTSGAGSSIGVDTTKAFRGIACLKEVCGAVLFATATLIKTFYVDLTKTGRVGMDLFFNWTPANAGTSALQMDFIIDIWSGNGKKHSQAYLRLSGNNNPSLQYKDFNGVFQNIKAGIVSQFDAVTWHNLKMVIDPISLKFVSVTFDGMDFSSVVAGIPYTPASNQTIDGVFMQAEAVLSSGNSALSETVYIDDIVLTVNEP